jgi:hypothetical protein
LDEIIGTIRTAIRSSQAPIKCIPDFSVDKEAEAGVDHPPHLATRLNKEYRYFTTSPPPLGVSGFSRVIHISVNKKHFTNRH